MVQQLKLHSNYFLVTACSAVGGAIVAWLLLVSIQDQMSSQNHQKMIAELTERLQSLEAELFQKNAELLRLRLARLAATSAANSTPKNLPRSEKLYSQTTEMPNVEQASERLEKDLAPYDIAKQLGTQSVQDTRSLADKVGALLKQNPSREGLAAINQTLVSLASDQNQQADSELQTIYAQQQNPEIRRVAAQTLALRGNTSLLNQYIKETANLLASESPLNRQQALQSLAKTHSAEAVKSIVPLLADKDINVKLDALLALGATGNQSHLGLIAQLEKDADPAVSLLARDVSLGLRNLSDYARTNLSLTDVTSEIPAF